MCSVDEQMVFCFEKFWGKKGKKEMILLKRWFTVLRRLTWGENGFGRSGWDWGIGFFLRLMNLGWKNWKGGKELSFLLMFFLLLKIIMAFSLISFLLITDFKFQTNSHDWLSSFANFFSLSCERKEICGLLLKGWIFCFLGGFWCWRGDLPSCGFCWGWMNLTFLTFEIEKKRKKRKKLCFFGCCHFFENWFSFLFDLVSTFWFSFSLINH